MNKPLLMLAFAMLFAIQVDAQVRRKYKDDKLKDHTVVIKEHKDVSDMDILNSEFDIDEFEVGQVIRITTENRQLTKVDTLAAQVDPIPKASEKNPPLEVVNRASAQPAKVPAKESTVSTSKKTYTPSGKRTVRNKKFKNKHYSFNKRKRSKRRVGKNKKTCFLF